MPDFSVDSWTSFKEQFMSVIRFILYCFDLFFDSVRSRPLLYVFFFFPIFAAALLILLSVVQRLFMTPESSDVALNRRGFGVLRLHGGKSDYKAIAVNLATTNHKLDSIDHKLGKVSTSAKLSSGKGVSSAFGKGVSAGMGKGKSANNISPVNLGSSASRALRSSLQSLASKKKTLNYKKDSTVNLSNNSSDTSDSNFTGPYMYDSTTTLNDSKFDIDVDD